MANPIVLLIRLTCLEQDEVSDLVKSILWFSNIIALIETQVCLPCECACIFCGDLCIFRENLCLTVSKYIAGYERGHE